VRQPALRVTQAGQSVSIPGRWVAMESPGGDGIAVGKGRYRGRILLFLNDRGTLNVIDELPLEQYLRGVVPSELGPAQYPEVEALKAQAVAARTYAVRTLGEFRQEGFDICATPRCQAYDGMGVEHPRSDQAVAETRGQILLWEGQPIDALYSATCGGHTEDVGVVFPLKKDEPYLKGVPCMEAGVARLGGSIASGTWPHSVVAALLGGGADTPQAYGQQLLLLARLAGVPAPPSVLQSFDSREVRRFVATSFDLALDARLFVAAEDLPYLVQAPPSGWSEEDRRLAALFVKLGLTEGAAAQLQPGDRDDLLYHLAVYLRVLREENDTFLALRGGQVHVRATDKEAKERDVAIAPTLATFRRSGETTTASTLALVPGDELQLVWQGDALVGLVQQVHPQGVAYDRSSSWSSWRRYRSDRDLQTLVQQRYPGFPFRSLEIVSRGVSGRVGELRLLGADGKSELVDGLAVRWTLDLPDTLFTARRLVPERGDPGWLFTGRGWGHGVGLCQVGAYGMALRGHDYAEILAHYYPGARLGGIPTQVRATSAAARAAVEAAAVSTRR
jgi:peptidoglycan hydrolase-like amidase